MNPDKLNQWLTLLEHWGIAFTMALGSYAAGSTPMGGGTVGFPVLVLLFDEAPTLGRDFSFAIQSIGMTSASIFILCRKQPIEWPMLRWASGGRWASSSAQKIRISFWSEGSTAPSTSPNSCKRSPP